MKKATPLPSHAFAALVIFFSLLPAQAAELQPARLVNISGRLGVDVAENVMIAGFIITGNVSKKVIIRGLGPSLADSGLSGVLADPLLELHGPNGTFLTNDDWRTSQAEEILATGIAPGDDLEAALVATLAPGAYTAVLRGADNSSGLGLIEVYDLDTSSISDIGNLSIRGKVEGNDKVMIAGVISAGEEALPVIVRAIGPSLGEACVEMPLLDPALELHDANGLLIASNDDWRGTQESELTASGLAPADDRESALALLLRPAQPRQLSAGRMVRAVSLWWKCITCRRSPMIISSSSCWRTLAMRMSSGAKMRPT